jgi:hypothetical protein
MYTLSSQYSFEEKAAAANELAYHHVDFAIKHARPRMSKWVALHVCFRTLQPAVDALRKDTHKLAHSTLCDALGVPPARVTWGVFVCWLMITSLQDVHACCNSRAVYNAGAYQ